MHIDDGISKITTHVVYHFLDYNSLYTMNNIKRQRSHSDVGRSKDHRLTAVNWPFHTHFRVCIMLIIGDPTVTVKRMTAVKTLFRR